MDTNLVSNGAVFYCANCACNVSTTWSEQYECYECDGCGEDIVCDNCGEVWNDDHECS